MASNPVNELDFTKRIADPIHGLIRLTPLESKVLQHPLFQRLRDISQLGMARYVYPGAMHSRFSHSLGVVRTVTQMFNAAYQNFRRFAEISGEVETDYIFSVDLLQTTRLAALCHDLGHFPFSHNLEPAFHWMAKSGLIDDAFLHEKLSAKIVETSFGPFLDGFESNVSDLIVSNFQKENKLRFAGSIISSAIDADRMDYLIRDSHHCGVDYGRFDQERLLDSIFPYSTKINGLKSDILAIHSKGIEAVEQFLLARHRMHQTIYFNPTVVGFEAGLRRAYYMISSDNPPWDLPSVFMDHPEKFIDFDESHFYVMLKKELRKRKSWLAGPLLERIPLRKIGPFYYTETERKELSEGESDLLDSLNTVKHDLEEPSNDWFGKDHWVYVETKEQRLVDPVPHFSNKSGLIDKNSSLKNTIFLVNDNGKIIDPTSISYGHTFLPFISGNTYYRHLFYSHKDDTNKLNKFLKPLFKEFEEFRSKNQYTQTGLMDFDL